jgi:hypothetical protein
MAVVYTTENVVVTVTTRDPAEGEGLLIAFDIVRDGTTTVKHIDQFFLTSKPNADMWEEMRPALREIIEDDYRKMRQATTAARAAAMRGLIDGKDWTLP